MLTPTAEWLIDALQNDPKVAEHFSISSWEGKNTCGTVGCIAGTAVAHHYQFKDSDNLAVKYSIFARNEYSPLMYCDVPGKHMTALGAKVLGLGIPTATHLFIPMRWRVDLMDEMPFPHLTARQRPTAERIELMREFTLNWVHYYITAPQAGRALKSVLVDEVPYVDWRRAVLEDV